MSRARTIRPGFFTNDDLGQLPPLTRILFAGLWTESDREGRLLDRPGKLKASLLPFDSCDVDAMLGELASRGLIHRYTSEQVRIIQVVNFHKHQNPHPKETPSDLPPYQADNGRGQARVVMHENLGMTQPGVFDLDLRTSGSSSTGSSVPDPRPARDPADPPALPVTDAGQERFFAVQNENPGQERNRPQGAHGFTATAQISLGLPLKGPVPAPARDAEETDRRKWREDMDRLAAQAAVDPAPFDKPGDAERRARQAKRVLPAAARAP